MARSTPALTGGAMSEGFGAVGVAGLASEGVHAEHSGLALASEPLPAERLRETDAALIATAHVTFDCQFIAEHAQLVVDTCDGMRHSGLAPERLVRA